MITVFTPAYNRAHCLQELYDSLCAQRFKDFEWIIVDDGSVDSTRDLVSSWVVMNRHDEVAGFKGSTASGVVIEYIFQPNGGKHRAVNRGVKEAHGELFFILDSDDALPQTSLRTVDKYWQQVKGRNDIGGIAGFMSHRNGVIIGQGNMGDVLDCNALDLRYKYHVRGDVAEVFRTSVLKENPFPEFADEFFCPEALVWNRIAQKYKLRYFREVIYFRDYLDGGLTDKIVSIRMESPVASTTHYCELSQYQIPFQQKVKAAINYWRFYACLQDKKKAPKLHWKWFWTRPLGVLMHQRDKR